MSSRQWKWIAAIAVADVVAFALTIHAHLTYHPAPDGPTVMTIGQLLGWIVSIGLLVVIILVVLAARQAERYRRLEQPAGHPTA